MTREQEDKIIEQAQGILEKRMAAETDIKINLQNVVYCGAYLLGALQATRRVTEDVLTGDKPKGEDWIYKKPNGI